MKKLFVALLMSFLILSGCTDELESDLEDIKYAYPDSKDVIVTLSEYNELSSGMKEQEVWDISGGECTKTGTTDLGIGNQYVTITYGCNGNGTAGSNVVLMFQGGKLSTMSQIGLK